MLHSLRELVFHGERMTRKDNTRPKDRLNSVPSNVQYASDDALHDQQRNGRSLPRIKEGNFSCFKCILNRAIIQTTMGIIGDYKTVTISA